MIVGLLKENIINLLNLPLKIKKDEDKKLNFIDRLCI